MVQNFSEFTKSNFNESDVLGPLMDVAEAMKNRDNIRVDKENDTTAVFIYTRGKGEQYDGCKCYYLMQENFSPNFFVAKRRITNLADAKMSNYKMIEASRDSVRHYITLTTEIREKLNLRPPYYVAVWYNL